MPPINIIAPCPKLKTPVALLMMMMPRAMSAYRLPSKTPRMPDWTMRYVGLAAICGASQARIGEHADCRHVAAQPVHPCHDILIEGRLRDPRREWPRQVDLQLQQYRANRSQHEAAADRWLRLCQRETREIYERKATRHEGEGRGAVRMLPLRRTPARRCQRHQPCQWHQIQDQ